MYAAMDQRSKRRSSAAPPATPPVIGQGNGMAGSYEIVRLNGGTYQIWTGDVVYELNKGKRRPGFQSMPSVFGTGVMFSLDTSKPFDLASTWFASASGVESLFLNSQTESASESGLDVAADCLHTGGRQPAKQLHRKIQGLLPAMDGEPLILDFSGLKSAASSFLDELLGRLAAEDPRGQAIFEAPVRIQGMTPPCRPWPMWWWRSGWGSRSAADGFDGLT
jgi:hypothetical protein